MNYNPGMDTMLEIAKRVDAFMMERSPVHDAMCRTIQDESPPYLNLKTLFELKIANGMTAAHRLQDLADAIQLIRIIALGLEYASQLNPFVREKYHELWQAAHVSEDY